MIDGLDLSLLVPWLLSLDWHLFFFGDGTLNLCDELIFGRYVVSVTGVSAGLRYGEIVFDDITSTGMTHGLQCGIVTTSGAAAVRDGLAVGRAGRIWSLGAEVTAPDHTDGPTFTAGEVAMFAVNAANGNCWVGKVGTGWYAGGDPATDTGPTQILPIGLFHLGAAAELDGAPPTGGAQFSVRTQAGQFTGSIPSGGWAWYT